MTDIDDELAELREQTQATTRAEAGGDEESDDPDAELRAALERAATKAEEEGKTPAIGCRDPVAWAFLEYATADEERARAITSALSEGLKLDVSGNETDKAGIIRRVFRRGLQDGAPEEYERLKRALKEHEE